MLTDYIDITIKSIWAGVVMSAVLTFFSWLSTRAMERRMPDAVREELNSVRLSTRNTSKFYEDMLRVNFDALNERIDQAISVVEFNAKMSIDANARNIRDLKRDIEDSLRSYQDHTDKRFNSLSEKTENNTKALVRVENNISIMAEHINKLNDINRLPYIVLEADP